MTDSPFPEIIISLMFQCERKKTLQYATRSAFQAYGPRMALEKHVNTIVEND